MYAKGLSFQAITIPTLNETTGHFKSFIDFYQKKVLYKTGVAKLLPHESVGSQILDNFKTFYIQKNSN